MCWCFFISGWLRASSMVSLRSGSFSKALLMKSAAYSDNQGGIFKLLFACIAIYLHFLSCSSSPICPCVWTEVTLLAARNTALPNSKHQHSHRTPCFLELRETRSPKYHKKFVGLFCKWPPIQNRRALELRWASLCSQVWCRGVLCFWAVDGPQHLLRSIISSRWIFIPSSAVWKECLRWHIMSVGRRDTRRQSSHRTSLCSDGPRIRGFLSHLRVGFTICRTWWSTLGFSWEHNRCQ